MVSLFACIVLVGCTSQSRNPEAIRRDTAKATSTATRDARAVAQGVVEGFKENRTIDINHSGENDLKSLPGIDANAAQRIIAGRPYSDPAELVHRHILPKREYDLIAGRIVAR